MMAVSPVVHPPLVISVLHQWVMSHLPLAPMCYLITANDHPVYVVVGFQPLAGKGRKEASPNHKMHHIVSRRSSHRGQAAHKKKTE